MRMNCFRYVTLLAFTLLISSCQDDVSQFCMSPSTTRSEVKGYTDYYWFKDQRIPLAKDSNASFVLFKTADKGKIISDFASMDIIINEENIHTCDYGRMEYFDEKSSCLDDLCWAKVKADVERILEVEEVEYAAPYMINADGKSIGLSNFLYVSLNNGAGIQQLKDAARELGLTIAGTFEEIPGLYILSCSRTSGGNALEAANILHEKGIFEYAEPDLMSVEFLSNDPYYSQQWNLRNTGQNGSGTSGYDIKYHQATSLIPSSSSIVVGVVDRSMISSHEDLNLTSTHWQYSPGHSEEVYSTDLMDHAVNVAGIISAKTNNNKGVAGIASPVKVKFLDALSRSFVGPDGDGFELSVAGLTAGIRYAVDHGVDVINCSWKNNYSITLDSAIEYATEVGRNGKGCVVVFSTGNENNSHINYPASFYPYSKVISVGAITYNGKRVDTTNSGGIHPWGSNYGTGLDVVAPGVGIRTTTFNNSYKTDFRGTSAAAPHVSAVAALILTKNPSLSCEQVGFIINATANKNLPGYTFSPNGFNGTWNNEVGHGLLDMKAALTLAEATTGSGSALSITGTGSNEHGYMFTGNATLNTDSNGQAWASLYVTPADYSYTYVWDAIFTGQCSRWELTQTTAGVGPAADVNITLSPGDAGGRLEARCLVFNGTTYVGKASVILYVNGNIY